MKIHSKRTFILGNDTIHVRYIFFFRVKSHVFTLWNIETNWIFSCASEHCSHNVFTKTLFPVSIFLEMKNESDYQRQILPAEPLKKLKFHLKFLKFLSLKLLRKKSRQKSWMFETILTSNMKSFLWSISLHSLRHCKRVL